MVCLLWVALAPLSFLGGFSFVLVSYPQVRRSYYLFFNYLFFNYLLGGQVSAENYPEGGQVSAGNSLEGGDRFQRGKLPGNHRCLWKLRGDCGLQETPRHEFRHPRHP